MYCAGYQCFLLTKLMTILMTILVVSAFNDGDSLLGIPDHLTDRGVLGQAGSGLSKPRAWKKPYVGQPSQSCWRNSGGRYTHQDFPPPNAPRQEETQPDSSSVAILHSRQPHEEPDSFGKDLLAAYHVICPRGGRILQMFMWGVIYYEGHSNVDMVPWHNILEFAGTFYSPRTNMWRSSWTSEWCMPVDKIECWYVATGHTQGRLNRLRRFISISLLRPAPADPQAPKVYEFCAEIGHVPRRTNGVSCIIEQIQTFNE